MRNIALFISLILTSSGLFAAEPGSGANPYSECGIGAALFKNTEWAAVTSNVTWDLGSTAITSATASPQTCSKKQVKAAMLIRDTYVSLVEDIARGQGSHLTAALDTFECRREFHAAVAQGIRADLIKVVASSGFEGQQHLAKATQLFQLMDGKTRSACNA